MSDRAVEEIEALCLSDKDFKMTLGARNVDRTCTLSRRVLAPNQGSSGSLRYPLKGAVNHLGTQVVDTS